MLCKNIELNKYMLNSTQFHCISSNMLLYTTNQKNLKRVTMQQEQVNRKQHTNTKQCMLLIINTLSNLTPRPGMDRLSGNALCPLLNKRLPI